MISISSFITNILAPFAMVVLYAQIASKEFRAIADAYPEGGAPETLDIGFHIQGNWLYRGTVRLGVNKQGLSMAYSFIPFLLPRTAFIPWSDITLQKQPSEVMLGFAGAPNCTVKISDSALVKMQLRLNGKVPFGRIA